MERLFKEIEHPFAWLHMDNLRKNIEYVNTSCGNKPVRIATKSIRSVEALRFIQAQLNNCSGFMTFSVAETLYLCRSGLNHFLIGYPIWEPTRMQELLQEIKGGKDITFMVDHEEQLIFLHTIASKCEVDVQICIDLNVSTDFKFVYFGTKRSPITSIEKLQQLEHVLKRYPRLIVHAVMAYDAQIAGVAERPSTSLQMTVRASVIRSLKRRSLPKVNRFRQVAVAYLKGNFPIQIVNGGGSGSMALCSNQEDITEITVGSAFFAPALFDGYDALHLNPAAGFGIRVVRKFNEQTVVCHGGGYIASGAPGQDRLPKFFNEERYQFINLEGAGEVQTPIIVKFGEHQIGDTILLRHAKAGELCERFSTLHIVEQDKLQTQWSTYRGDGQCFL